MSIFCFSLLHCYHFSTITFFCTISSIHNRLFAIASTIASPPSSFHHRLFTIVSSPSSLHHRLFTIASPPSPLHHRLFTIVSPPSSLHHRLFTIIRMFCTNALSSDATEDEIWNFLKLVKMSDFDIEKSQHGLIKPAAPSIWLYFAVKDKDKGQKADQYR